MKLSVRELLKFGWDAFKKRPWFFVATLLIYMAVQIVLTVVQGMLPELVGFILSVVVSTLFYTGLIAVYLAAHDNPQTPSLKDLWNPTPFWKYLLLSILLVILVGLGLVLLVIPGIFLSILFMFSGYLVVEKGMNPIAALKESARLTKGNRWKLFFFGLAVIVLAILGSIPLFLGLLVVAPVVMLASIHAYRLVSGQAPAAA